MAQFNIFVGRERVLSQITTLAKEESNHNHLVLIGGDGGVGKTFLLQKIAQEYKAKGYLVDYYDLVEQPAGNMRETLHLMNSLEQKNFPNFQEKLNDFASGQHDIGDLSLPQLEEDVLNACLGELNSLIARSGKRFIRLMDTFELSPLQQAGEGLFVVEKKITNALFIVAGRNIKKFRPDFEKSFGKENITEIELEGFNEKEAAEFFGKLDENSQIPNELREKLNFLTNGRPVLLALSIEWLKHKLPLPEITGKSLENLQKLKLTNGWVALNNRFEFDLVDSVRSLKSPSEKAILYMAQITKRFNERILAKLLNLQDEDAEKLLAEIAKLSFVRSNSTNQVRGLHDEMKNLVNRYVWPLIDSDGTTRQDLFQKVIREYYEPRLDEIANQIKIKSKPQPEKGPILRVTISDEEWEQWRLEAECLYYHLRVGENDGRTYFDKQYDEARRCNHLVRMQFLLSEIDAASKLYPDLESIKKLKTAEQLWMRGELDSAQDEFQKILNEQNLSLDDQISVNNMLGYIAARREPQKAEHYFKKALSLAQHKDDKGAMGAIYNNLGQFYCNASRLDEAIENYEKAIENSKKSEKLAVVASATNNLAFVYRLQGNLGQANAKCRLAMAQRKKLGIERDLAFSYLTKAEIDRDEGSIDEAERNTKLALQIFKKINDISGQSRSYRSLANVSRYREQFKEAESYLENGIALAKQVKDDASLARLYHVYGQEQRRVALHMRELEDEGSVEDKVKLVFENAENRLNQSQFYAQKYEDQRLLAHNEHELAIVYFHSEKCSEKELVELLDKLAEKAVNQKDDLLLGQIDELKGDIALRSKDYSTAAKYIGLAAQKMGGYSGREVSRFIERASERIVDPALNPSESKTLAQGILDIIKDVSGENISALKVLCKDALNN